MSGCVGCEPGYYRWIVEVFENNDSARDLLRNHGVLPSVVTCPRCDNPCKLSGGKDWRCTSSHVLPKTKKRRLCGFRVSDNKGTFLDNAHLPPWKIVLFINHWVSKLWDHKTVIDNLGISTRTSVDWRSFCSEVTDHWLENQDSIGGDGIFVEIDETLLVKRKYERGRGLAQIWVFGGIERVTKKKFVVPLVGAVGERRDAATLMPLILKYIRPGSIIVSDQWGAYNRVKDHGYTHYTINHSENFVDPEDCEVHTQNVERLWRDLKEWVKRPGIKSNFLQQYLARYLFVKAHGDQSFHQFLLFAAKLYPHGGELQRRIPVPIQEDSDE